MRFVIVTPCLNAARFIDETILSVILQRGDFFIRYHIQDGGSTDGTREKIRVWAELLRDRKLPIACNEIKFSFASEPDDGLYDALSKGFARAGINSNQAMTWINAGDRLESGALQTIDAIFSSQSNVHWVSGRMAQINESGSVIRLANPHTDRFRHVIAAGIYDGRRRGFIQQEGIFWRSELWKRVGGLNAELRLAGDFDLWRRFAQDTDLVGVDTITAYFRIHGDRIVQNFDDYFSEIDALMAGEAATHRDRLWRDFQRITDANELSELEKAGFCAFLLQWDLADCSWKCRKFVPK